MLTRRHGQTSSKTLLMRLAIVCVVSILAGSLCLAQNAPQGNLLPSSREVVILMDINPNQRKVFSLESSLATGVLDHLDQQSAAVSLITFGSMQPAVGCSNAKPGRVIDEIKNVHLEQPGAQYFPIHVYRAIDLALDQFSADARPKSLFILAEGRENFGGKAFKRLATRARQIGVNCYVALVASHSLRGSKSVLIYGFYLSDLARATHGRCIEVGDRQKKLSQFVDRFSKDILEQSPTQPSTPRSTINPHDR